MTNEQLTFRHWVGVLSFRRGWEEWGSYHFEKRWGIVLSFGGVGMSGCRIILKKDGGVSYYLRGVGRSGNVLSFRDRMQESLKSGTDDAIYAGRFISDIIKLFWYYRIQMGRLKSHKNDAAHATISSVDKNRVVCAWLYLFGGIGEFHIILVG